MGTVGFGFLWAATDWDGYFLKMSQPRVNPYICIAVSVISISFAAIFIRLLQDLYATSFLIIAFYRLFLTVLILTPIFVVIRGWRKLLVLPRKMLLKIIGAGIMLALHFMLWIASLGETSVASSVIIVNTGSIFAIVLAYFLLKEQLSRGRLFGILIAFSGVCIMALSDWTYETAVLGDFLALFSAITFGFYLIVGRQARQQLDIVPYAYLMFSVCTLTLFIPCAIWDHPFMLFDPIQYLLFLALAVFPTIFGHMLYTWSLKYVDTAIVGVALFAEPVGAIILGALILKETPYLISLIGGVLVLIGVFIAIRMESQLNSDAM